MPRRRLTAACGAGVAALLVGAPLPVTAAPDATEPPLVNEELVVSEVDASGLPVDTMVYSRVTARDYPEGTIKDPSSTTEVRYVDRRGSPETSGSDVILPVGGAGEISVTTQAVFDKPLPVAMHVQYAQGPTVVPPGEVSSTEGEMRITYTVTNTTAKEEVIRYQDASGTWHVDKQPVFAPFVGTLIVTLPEGVSVRESPKAIRGTTPDGRTQLQYNLVLYPPLGGYEQDATMVVEGHPLAVPSANLQVVPVQSGQSPTQQFSTDLLSKSVEGNADLAEGMLQLDTSAAALAEGAAKLSLGLRRLQLGTDALTTSVNQLLVPGAEKLADGAGTLASGQSKAARGTQAASNGAEELDRGAQKLAKGQRRAAEGTQSAYDGARQLEEGADALSDGLTDLHEGLQKLNAPDAVPAARDSADALAQVILRLQALVGSAGDPPVRFPPSQSSTLVQAVRSSASATGTARAGAAKATTNLNQIAQSLTTLATRMQQVSALAGDAESGAGQVYQEACVDTSTLTPAQCSVLQQAVADAGEASTKANQAATETGQQAGRTEAQAALTGAIALGLGAVSQTLIAVEDGLIQLSLALASGNPESPGVHEGLVALADGLDATVNALSKLTNGAAASAGGADELGVGSTELASGLGDLADGSEELADGATELGDGAGDLSSGLTELADGTSQLADGARQLADGADAQAEGTAKVGDGLDQVDEGLQDAAAGSEELGGGAASLQEDGTSRISQGIVDASKDPAFAEAYLKATEDRAADALPYGAPEGAAGHVAYIYTLPGDPTDTGATGKYVGWGLLAVIVAALAGVAWRRLHPVGVTAPTGGPDEPEPIPVLPVVPEAESLPEDDGEAPEAAAPESPFAPDPGVKDDDDWFFGPPDR